MRNIISLFLLFGFGIFAFGQNTHTVIAKDNPYSIAKKYGITLDELLKLNPKIKDGKLNIGDVLMVNKKTVPQKPASTIPISAKTGKIFLQPKQTIYGITKQYHIAEVDLRKLNPDLDNHLKIGDAVILPTENIKKYADKSAFENENTVSNTPKIAPEKVSEISTNASSDSYVIQPKDNYYRITKNFNLTQNQLFELNPGLEEKGLAPGNVIKVKYSGEKPVSNPSTSIAKEPNSTEPKASVQEDYQTYTVQSGDTVFEILNKFNINLDQLLALNPQISEGLKMGMVLKIKKLDSAYAKKSGDALNVVLMLPFGFDSGDAKYRTMATDFLTGAKLAIERNVGIGQKLEINVIDAGSEASFKNSLTQINQNNTDLIIGPFFKSNVLDVLEYVKNQKIPVVAPFASSSELKNHDNLVIIETDLNIFADRIAKEVGQIYSDQKIYIVADSNHENANYLKNQLIKESKNANIILVNSPADIQLDQNMMTGQKAPVIAILANDDNNIGLEFSKKIIEISKEIAGVKSFSMYYHSSFEKNIDELSQASLIYLMDRKINTEGDFEKEILAAYKKKYCKTPSKYAIIGFDVVNDMLTRENKKGELFKQMSKVQTQLATKFEFVRTKNNGAYINTGYRVVRLVP